MSRKLSMTIDLDGITLGELRSALSHVPDDATIEVKTYTGRDMGGDPYAPDLIVTWTVGGQP